MEDKEEGEILKAFKQIDKGNKIIEEETDKEEEITNLTRIITNEGLETREMASKEEDLVDSEVSNKVKEEKEVREVLEVLVVEAEVLEADLETNSKMGMMKEEDFTTEEMVEITITKTNSKTEEITTIRNNKVKKPLSRTKSQKNLK